MTRISLTRSLALLLTGLAVVAGPRLEAAAPPVQETTPPSETGAHSAEEPAVPPPASPPRRGTLPGDVQKVFVLQHVEPQYLTRLLQVFPAEISSVGRTRGGGVPALAVSAKPAVVAAIEETIKRLDRPTAEPADTSNIELTGYVLEGLAEPTATESLPSELQGVVDQLRRTFAYPGYRLLDTLVARSRGDGSRSEVSGVTTEKISALAPSFYSLTAHTTIQPSSNLIRLSNLSFSIEMPVPVGPPMGEKAARSFQYKSIGLRSNIDVREGQFAVVGKSGLGNSENALVLVLAARIVD